MSWLRCLYVAVCVVVLTGCHAASAGSRGQGGGGGGGERSKLAPRPYRLPPRRHTDTEDFLIDEDDLMDTPKRAYSDYGHMRFGKRDDKFDEYGHMRFGRAEY